MQLFNKSNSFFIWVHTIDWKGNIKGILILLIVVLFFCGALFYSDISQAIKLKKYKGEVVGQFLSYKENTYLSQSRTGNNITTLNYEIEYSFNINGESYHTIAKLNKQQANLTILSKIKSGQRPLIIKYNPDNPEESTVLIE